MQDYRFVRKAPWLIWVWRHFPIPQFQCLALVKRGGATGAPISDVEPSAGGEHPGLPSHAVPVLSGHVAKCLADWPEALLTALAWSHSEALEACFPSSEW